MTSVRLGVVLSAGGVRGVYAHTGFLEAIEAMHLPVHAVAGCSAGAIIGGIYASGTPLENWLKSLGGLRRDDFWTPGSWRRALWELVRYRACRFTGVATTTASLAFCRENIAVDSFNACRIPFHAVATSLASGQKVMFSSGDLALGIAASASIPLLYQPVEIEGEYYCDGGVMDLGPTDAICCHHGLDVLIVHHVATRLKGFHGVENSDNWPILEIVDTLMFRNRPWYLSNQPLTFRQCPCGCNALIIVLEPQLPELPWPQIAGGPEVQAMALRQTRALLEPWLDSIQNNLNELRKQTQPLEQGMVVGGCHC